MSDEIKLTLGVVGGFVLFFWYVSSLMTRDTPKKKSKTKPKGSNKEKITLESEAKLALSNIRKAQKTVEKLKKSDDKKSKLALKRIGDEAYSVCVNCE